jgi:hypothetical protein
LEMQRNVPEVSNNFRSQERNRSIHSQKSNMGKNKNKNKSKPA